MAEETDEFLDSCSSKRLCIICDQFRAMGEMTLSDLPHSGLQKLFWWDAYKDACYISRMMPTQKLLGVAVSC